MSRSSWSRRLALLAVLFLLASPILAFGGGFEAHERGPAASGALWRLLSGLLPFLETAHGTMDPNGQPSAGSTPTETSSAEGDARGTMDPNG